MSDRRRSDTSGSRAPSVPIAVIVTGGEHVSVLAAVRALRAAGYAPWVAVHGRGGYATRSRARAGVITVPSPAEDSAGFVRALAAEAKRIPAAVILPGTELALVALAEHASAMPPGVVLGACSPSVVANATDKGRLESFAAAAGLAVPPTVEISLTTASDPLPFAYPVVVKPRRSEHRGADGVVRHVPARPARSGEELRHILAALPDSRGLVQPFLHEPLQSIAGVFWGDRTVAAIQSRSERLWPVQCGSISYAQTVPLQPELATAVTTLLREVGWQGIFQIDFFEHAGRYVIIDLNPRFYTSLSQATRAGLNLPAIWVDLLLGREPVVHHGYRIGVRYRHEEGDARALTSMLIRGPRAAALRGLTPRRDTAFAVLSAGDPWPVLSSLTRLSHCLGWRRARAILPPPATGIDPTLRPER